ncbi:MAG TPA: helix-turn-helix domain-containing protein [Actinomycetes bacterium]
MSHRASEWVKALDTRLRGAPRAVLLILADHANGEHLTWPSERRIAKESGVSYAWVRKLLPAFVVLEVLEEKEPARGTLPAKYRFRYPDPAGLPRALSSSALRTLLERYSVSLERYSVPARALPSSAEPHEPLNLARRSAPPQGGEAARSDQQRRGGPPEDIRAELQRQGFLPPKPGATS